MSTFISKAPGRICLFGEHQDYLGLPVITAAIDRYITFTGKENGTSLINFDMPDINATKSIDLSQPIVYENNRDYLASTINILRREGVAIQNGFDITMRGNIPINSGTSSSTAMTIAWVNFLLNYYGDERGQNPLDVAILAHRAEVLEFKEPGGQMDHFASAFGSAMYIDFGEKLSWENLHPQFGAFVLGDSQEPKDTTGILGRVKGGVLGAMQKIQTCDSSLNFTNIIENKLTTEGTENGEEKKSGSKDSLRLTREQYQLIKANIINRDITQQALKMLEEKHLNHQKLGNLLNVHQEQLAKGLEISTPKIDRMINAALDAGALGAKINGSGGGGCMFAYAPNDTDKVVQAIEKERGLAYIIHVGSGVSFETIK